MRNVAFFAGRVDAVARNYTAEMKVQLDTPDGRRQYGERFAAVEPVFRNLRGNKRLDRFTLRGRAKVDAQWKPYWLVHNIEKLANAGYAAERRAQKELVRCNALFGIRAPESPDHGRSFARDSHSPRDGAG